MAENESWLDKCLKCKHVYETIDDDYVKCRLKNGCRFEEYKIKGKDKNVKKDNSYD